MKETDAVSKAVAKARQDGMLTEGLRVNLPCSPNAEHSPLVGMSEKDFQRQVLVLAKARGWMSAHFRPAKTEKGWRTAMEGDPGFPDLVLARRGVVIFAELKSENGKTTPGQDAWLDALAPREGNMPVACVWKPSMMEQIEKVLA